MIKWIGRNSKAVMISYVNNTAVNRTFIDSRNTVLHMCIAIEAILFPIAVKHICALNG